MSMVETPARRPIQPAEIAALILGLASVIGCLLVILSSTVMLPWWSYAIWIAMLATAINLGISFESGDANFGSIVIVAAFLALGLAPAALITITGVLLGEVLRHLIPRPLGFTPRGARHAWVTAGSNLSLHGLSLLVGGTLYTLSGGLLPIVEAGQSPMDPGRFRPRPCAAVGLVWRLSTHQLHDLRRVSSPGRRTRSRLHPPSLAHHRSCWKCCPSSLPS